MKKVTGILFVIFMVFLFLEILIGFPISLEHEPLNFSSNKNESQASEAQNAQGQGLQTQQKMQGVHLVESQSGNRDWELFSESAETTGASGGWQLQNVKVLFYNKDRVDFTVTGQRGTIEANSKNMRIEGNVVTKSANGYVFQSNSVSYLAASRIIKTPDSIKMLAPPDDKGKGMLLTGIGMEANVEKSLMKIMNKVSASKEMSDGKQFQIQSETAEFSGKDRRARFIDNVGIDIGSVKMQGPEAQFDYRLGVDVLQSVVVKGGVKVSDVDKFATADTVTFDPEQNKFVFNGRPRVVQNQDEITGEQIVFIDGGKKVRVERIRAKVEKQ